MAYPYALSTFEESFYLANNPDVVTAIANGDFSSALQHYEMYGENEGRLPNSAFSPQFYFSTYPDVLAAVNAGTIPGALWHFENFGLAEARRPSEQVDFNEANYLALNPDVAAAVAAGDFVSGWQHYVMFGQDEGREPGGTTPPPGEVITLTPGVDTVLLDGLQVDTVRGVVDPGTPQQNTFSIGDLIDGNGNTLLDLAVASGGNAAFATVKDVASINLLAGTAAAINFNAVAWSGVGAIDLSQGVNGLDATFNNIQAGADLSVAQVSGSLEANQTNGVGIGVWSHQGGSVSYTADLGNVVGTAVTGMDVGADFYAIANGAAVSVGDVTLTGTKADEGELWVSQTQDKGGDIAVGNVSISGFASIDVGIYNTDHTKDSAAVNTTVGDITVATGKSGSASITVSQTGDAAMGNVTVGNVSMEGGDDAYLWFYSENYVNNAVANANAAVGNTTIGNIVASAGMSGTVSIDVSNSANAQGGTATNGDVTLGTVTASVGQDGYFYFILYNTADTFGATGSGDAVVGTTTVGDVSLTLATDASGTYEMYVSADASGTGDATVGNVVVGNFAADLGVNASLTVTYTITAEVNAGKATVSDVTFGNVNFFANDGASIDYSVSVSSDNNIGNLTYGDLTVAGNVSADVWYYNYAWADDDIASLTVGNVDVAMKQGGYFYGSISMSASSGEFGDVAIGDVSLAAAKDATADFYIDIQGETGLGNVTVGGVSLAAQAAAAQATLTAYFSNDGAGTIGDVTFGNVAMSAAGGQGASSDLYVWVGSAASAGTLTFGDFDLSVNNKTATAVTNWSYVSVTVDNDLGNLVIGDINLSTQTVLAATTDKNFVYASVSADAQGTLTVGNITVSGGDGAADNFADLNGWLNLTSGAGKITIGDVDYSGYGAKATIDVSGYAGAANIAGGAMADTITDNKGTNAITGNGGADSFVFLDTNTGLGLETLDKILDFSNSGGDKIDLSVVVNVGNYSEGTYADFAAFKSAAGAADKAVFVGDFASSGGVVAAVDYDTDGAVDYMIQLVGVDLAGVDVASFV